MGKKSKKPGIMARANYSSNKALGKYGRPAAVGSAAGLGAYFAGQKWDVDFLQSGWNCAAVGLGTAATVEGAFYLFGDDEDLHTVEAVARTREALVDDKDGDLLQRLEDAGADKKDVAVLSVIQSRLNADKPKGKKPKAKKESEEGNGNESDSGREAS